MKILSIRKKVSNSISTLPYTIRLIVYNYNSRVKLPASLLLFCFVLLFCCVIIVLLLCCCVVVLLILLILLCCCVVVLLCCCVVDFVVGSFARLAV
jgi:hypothetical protein